VHGHVCNCSLVHLGADRAAASVPHTGIGIAQRGVHGTASARLRGLIVVLLNKLVANEAAAAHGIGGLAQ
jgi:hypothetical protein